MAWVVVLSSCLLPAACAALVLDDGAYRHAALQTSLAVVSDLASGQPVPDVADLIASDRAQIRELPARFPHRPVLAGQRADIPDMYLGGP